MVLFLNSSPVVYWIPVDLGGHFSVSYLFHTVHGVLKESIVKWFAIPSPVGHILSGPN